MNNIQTLMIQSIPGFIKVSRTANLMTRKTKIKKIILLQIKWNCMLTKQGRINPYEDSIKVVLHWVNSLEVQRCNRENNIMLNFQPTMMLYTWSLTNPNCQSWRKKCHCKTTGIKQNTLHSKIQLSIQLHGITSF